MCTGPQLTSPIGRGSQSQIHKHPWAACGINSTGLAVGTALHLWGSQAVSSALQMERGVWEASLRDSVMHRKAGTGPERSPSGEEQGCSPRRPGFGSRYPHSASHLSLQLQGSDTLVRPLHTYKQTLKKQK